MPFITLPYGVSTQTRNLVASPQVAQPIVLAASSTAVPCWDLTDTMQGGLTCFTFTVGAGGALDHLAFNDLAIVGGTPVPRLVDSQFATVAGRLQSFRGFTTWPPAAGSVIAFDFNMQGIAELQITAGSTLGTTLAMELSAPLFQW